MLKNPLLFTNGFDFLLNLLLIIQPVISSDSYNNLAVADCQTKVA
jgi:hypothetical protein